MKVSVKEFKTNCLNLMETVRLTREEIVICQRGKPVAKLVPFAKMSDHGAFGFMRGLILQENDIVSPVAASWHADR